MTPLICCSLFAQVDELMIKIEKDKASVDETNAVKPLALNPQPSTLNPKPSTLDPKP
jgi:hypothetical protein